MIVILVIVKVQGKFQMSLGAEGNHNPHHGIRVEVAWDFHNHCHIKGSINIITIAIINTSIALNCFRPQRLWCWMHSAILALRWMIILTNVLALEMIFWVIMISKVNWYCQRYFELIFRIDILSHHDLQGDRNKRGLERIFVDLGEESGRGPSVQISRGVL